MGICSSCCGGEQKEPLSKQEQTERDRVARERAADAAAQRQTNFEASPVGKAAYKSVEAAKKQDERSKLQDEIAKGWRD